MTVSLEEVAKAILLAEEQGVPIPGPEGPRGIRGPDGPPGLDGIEGRPGPIGPKGDPGPRGFPGQDGKDGKDGEDGEDGKDGKKGDRGLRGEKGDRGDRGPEGKDGRPGPQGIRGPAGRGGNLGGGSGGGGGSQIAATVPFTPAGTISATNVQAAIEEVAAEAGSGLPPQWTDGGNGDVTANVDDASKTPLTINGGSTQTTTPALQVNGAAHFEPTETNALNDNGLVYVKAPVGAGDNGVLLFQVLDSDGVADFLTIKANGQVDIVVPGFWADQGYGVNIGVAAAGGGMIVDIDKTIYGIQAAHLGNIVAVTVDGNIGFFDKASVGNTAPQQTAASLSDLWAALKDYGLLDSGSVAPSSGGSGSFLSIAKWT